MFVLREVDAKLYLGPRGISVQGMGEFSISAVAHSMGCAALSVYMISQLVNEEDHFLHKVPNRVSLCCF